MKKIILLFALAIFGYGLQAQQCQAYFTYTVDTNGTTVSFVDQSSVDDSSDYITSWSWDFGDGTNDTLQNETHTYATQGTYVVCLTINTNMGYSATYCDSVVGTCAGFYVAATVTNESGQGAQDGAIDATVYGGTSPYTYYWDNGATTQDLNNISTGNYCLTVADANGCSAANCFYVYQGQNCQAYFTYTVDTNGTTVSFVDQSYAYDSLDYIISWSWDFGDGTNDTLQNETHTYATQGTYVVCLTVITDMGASDTYCDSVVVGTNPCAGFYVTATVTNESAPGAYDGAIDATVYGGTQPYAYYWDNNATTEDLSNISAGNYCLTVADANGCSTVECFYVYQDSTSIYDSLITTTIDTCLNFTVDTSFVSSYTWLDSTHVEMTWVFQGGGQTVTITADYEVYQSGYYVVLVSLNCGTKALTTYSSEIYIDQYTGLGNIEKNDNRLILYPDPASDILNVVGIDAGSRINIFNATGQLVRQFNIMASGNTTINVSDLQKGVYIIKIESDNKVMTGRFTK